MTDRRRRAGARRVALFFGLILAVATAAGAEPYLAVRTGFACGQCHVNHTGGGKRNAFGEVYARTHLYMALVRSDDHALVDGSLSSTISVGGDLRVRNVSRLAHESDEGVRASSTNGSSVSTAQIYGDLVLVPGALRLYVDQTVSPQTTNRELFALLESRARTIYLKVGRMLLPYGLRLIDDDAFIRSRTGYSYSRHDLGVEVGSAFGPHTLNVNVTDDQLSGRFSLIGRHARVGGSYGRSIEQSRRYTAGVFGGVHAGRLTFLGEVDWITEGTRDRAAYLAELDVLLARGLNAKVTYELFDRNRDVPNDRDGQERITMGVEPFIMRSLQVRVFYRINRFVPQNLPENQDELSVEVHAFF